jgi:lantibiotic modifying enzyme
MRAADFVESIIAGFREMHTFILARPKRFQKAVVRTKINRCRYIYRPTLSYASILNQSLSPALLRDGVDRSLFLMAFCRDGLVPTRILQSELAALERGDIPIAYGRASRPLQPPPETIMKEMLSQIRRAFATSKQV